MGEEQKKATTELRLYDLISLFEEGDERSYFYIIKRFAGLIDKESYNRFLGMLDEDLRAQIYLTLFVRLKRFKVPDKEALVCMNEPSK